MLQPPILAILFLVVSFVQPIFPSPEDLKPITPQNASSLKQVAAIGSDTLDNVLWSPDGQILAAITSGQVILYKVNDLKTIFRTIPHRVDEAVSFTPDGHLSIGKAVWDIQNGTFETLPSGFFQHSPSGKLEVTSTNDGKQTVVIISDTRRDKPLQLRTGTTGILKQVVFSPDEKFAAVELSVTSNELGLFEGVELWNIESGTLVASLEQALETIEQIEFSADGKLLVTSTSTDAPYGNIFQDVRVWEGHTGKWLNPKGPISGIPAIFSPGKHLMVYTTFAGLSLWSDHEIGYLGANPSGDTSNLYSPLFSPDGKSLLAIGNRDIVIWDTETAVRLGEPRLVLDAGNVDDYFFSADGKRLIVISRGQIGYSVHIWDFTKPTPTLMQVIPDLTSAEMNPDLTRVWGDVYINASKNRMLVDATNGQRLFTFPANAKIDPQWKYVAYWLDQTLTVVDLNQKVTTTLKPLPDYLGTARFFNVQGGRIVFVPTTSNASDFVKVYDLQNGHAILSFEDTPNGEYILSEDGYLLSVNKTGTYGTTVNVRASGQADSSFFDLTIEDKTGQFFLLPHQDKLAYIDKPTFVSGGATDQPTAYTRLEIWGIHAPRQRQASWLIQANVQVYSLNSGGSVLAMGSGDYYNDPSIKLLDLDQPQTSVRSFELPTYDTPLFKSIQFSPNDEYLAVSVDDQLFGDSIIHQYSIFLFETRQFDGHKTGDSIEPFTLSSVTSPLFSANNQFLLANEPYTSYESNEVVYKVHLWRLKDKVELSSFVGDGIKAFSPDSSLIAVHNQTQTDIYSTNDLSAGSVKPLITLPDNEGHIKDLGFSADGKRLYLVGEARVRVYGISLGE